MPRPCATARRGEQLRRGRRDRGGPSGDQRPSQCGPEVARRNRGSLTRLADRAPLRAQGPHPDDQPAARLDPDRTRTSARPTAEPAPTTAADHDDLVTITKLALRELATRIQDLDTQIIRIATRHRQLLQTTAPRLLAITGVGPDTATALLLAAGDNPRRLCSNASFAALLGASPIPASSGKTNRHRLNRGGDRHGNSTLWRIVMVRMASQPATRAYVERRTKEGPSKPEIIRCLTRYVAREDFNAPPKDVLA